MFRVLAVDVGVKHLSYVVLRCAAAPASLGGRRAAPTASLAHAVDVLRGAGVEAWAVEALRAEGDAAAGFAGLLEAAAAFVTAKRDVLLTCDVLVIEQQMAPLMRCVAAAIFAAARAVAPALRIAFQPGAAKLSWDAEGLAARAPGASKESYHRRKKMAVDVCRSVLVAAGQTAALERFHAHGKKDDLADALLHALRHASAEAAPPKKRARAQV